MTSSPLCWWTKTNDLSLATFVCPPEVLDFSTVIGVPSGWFLAVITQEVWGEAAVTILVTRPEKA